MPAGKDFGVPRVYGSFSKQAAYNVTCGLAVKMPRKKQERQPLLLSTNEPVNDTYDRCGQARLDLRSSPPDSVMVHLSSSPMEGVQTPDSTQKVSDPVLNRNLEHPTSNLDTMIHLLKGNIGVGILAMPNAFSHAGLAVGTVGTLLMGVICTHCMHILVNCAHELCRRTQVSSLGFSEVVETSFATGPLPFRSWSQNAKRLVNLFLVITQLGFCCSYFVFVAANLKEVIGTYWLQLDVHAYLAILLVPMILLNWIKNLKYLAPVSMFAALLTSTGLGITFFYMVQGLPKTTTVRMAAPWHELPLFFGTAIYAFEGIGVILPLENNMANPQDFGGFTGVLNTGMGIVAVLYTSVGFFGYLKYGFKVHGSITLDLPAHDMMAQSVRLIMAFAIFMSYGLQFYVPMNIMWPFVKERLSSEKAHFYGEYVMRTLLVILTFTLASVIHDLSSVISLVGAVSSSALALMFPPIIEIVTFWDEDIGVFRWMIWKNVAIIIFGFLGFVFGTYVSVANIMNGTTG